MDKPTLRTLHGTFTQPVHLYHDLAPDRQAAATADRPASPNRLRSGLRSFALTAISLRQHLLASQAPRPVALRYQKPA